MGKNRKLIRKPRPRPVLPELAALRLSLKKIRARRNRPLQLSPELASRLFEADK